MPSLALCLLGTYRAYLDGRPAAAFESNKARGLLAYLAVEARQHERPYLAGLLWPDWPEATARTYLRQALANLRAVIEPQGGAPPFLLSSRHTLQFNPECDHQLDVAAFTRAMAELPRLDRQAAPPAAMRALEEAVALYQGDFLAGFYLDGCPAYEEWQLLTRETLRGQAVEATGWLAARHHADGDLARAQQYARRSLELEPLREESHALLMRLLTLAGDRNAALAHFASYRRRLAGELGVEPSPEISELHAQIKSGRLPDGAPPGGAGPAAVAARPPSWAQAPSGTAAHVLCVAREPELALLDTQLGRALAGQGGVIFVTGEAGRGKTTLLRAFIGRAQEQYPQLIVAGGLCSSHAGFGDALLPFREMLGQLTGDCEAQWVAGTLGAEHARRLWSILPAAVEALLTEGPGLINTLIPGPGLAARAALCLGCQAWVRQIEALNRTRPQAQPTALFEQARRALQALAHRHPLLLWIDDLHWVDRASSALLFHLAPRLAGSQILLVGAYRPEEVHAGREGARHPLDKVLHELRARFGSTQVDLDRAESRPFIDAYLDLEPNRLDGAFRERLHRLSDGHPLFTVELVRSMRERGGLVQDAGGRWCAGPALDWDALPGRVEAVIAERVDRLPPARRAALDVASVEGEEFTAEVVAHVLRCDVGDVIRSLSQELDRQHHLVAAVDLQSIGSRRLSHYRFRHHLFQKYLYGALDGIERQRLHEAVARSLAALVEGQPEATAAAAGQLLWHFAQAGLWADALPYARPAGERALQLSANEEAVAYYRQGLSLLGRLPDAGLRRAQEVDLQMGLGTALALAQRHSAEPAQAAFLRANRLSRELNDLPRLLPSLWGLWRFHFVRGEVRASLDLARECMQVAGQLGDPPLLVQAHEALGTSLSRLGSMAQAREHFAQARVLYDLERQRGHAYLYGQDAGVSCLANEAQVTWYLGYPEQAQGLIGEALARAESGGHTASLAFALVFAAGLYQRMGDAEATLKYAERTIDFSRRYGFAQWVAVGTLYRGWARVSLGETSAGLAEMRLGFEATSAAEVKQLRYAALLAAAAGAAGETAAGLAQIGELLEAAVRLGELEWAAEMYRAQGELHVSQGAYAAAQACLEQAISLAREQSARSLELRATLSLGRLWLSQGKPAEAHARLAAIYAWFTEGHRTPDLKAARALLDGASL